MRGPHEKYTQNIGASVEVLDITMGANFHITMFKKATPWLVMYHNEVFNFGFDIIIFFLSDYRQEITS